MEIAYDHIQEEILAPEEHAKGKDAEKPNETLNDEFREAYKAVSASPWGSRLGSFLGTVRKQGESYYESSKKEYATVSEQATKGFSDLRTNITSRTRSLSITQALPQFTLDPLPEDEQKPEGETSKARTEAAEGAKEKEKDKPQGEGLLTKLKKGAAQRISEIEAAEARADEYLLKFGSNIGSFLRDAVTIAPPEEKLGADGSREVVFEAKGMDEGKRQIYTTRLDAQLHLLHSNHELFKTGSDTDSFKIWVKDFNAEKETDQIAADLERYPELRNTMEKLVPNTVQYSDFWARYYFLRNELGMEEQKRKELLKGATLDEEEVGWDEDDSDVEKSPANPSKSASAVTATATSTETLTPKEEHLKPKSSIDRTSQPDSESSYDLVSGAASKAPSQAAGSPPAPKVIAIIPLSFTGNR
ncbi:BSD-domain-containing protein [Choiromyces venosus 120613-1]|uniref:BSD-domain-containing protein n=1 Tax=Choiromyces venosus 120613-1 TaxID=1336337 RepID=A0A3N4JEP4_9PEZI|nr:BSD-domain-containing protein [Choiromyces venosus 120613-1]